MRARLASSIRSVAPVSWVVASLAMCGGCDRAPEAAPRELPVMAASETELYAFQPVELERMLASIEAAATRDASSRAELDVLAAARAATRIARVHTRVGGTCTLCSRSRRLIERAIASEPRPETCEAAVDFMRVLVRDAGDRTGASELEQQLRERFQATHAECLAAARALLAAPSPAVASGALADAGGSAAPEPAVPAARLRSIQVFGASGAEDDHEVRVVLGLDGPAVYRRGELAAELGRPRRIVLDLERVSLDRELVRDVTVDRAGLARIRARTHAPGHSQLEFDVASGTQQRLFVLTSPYRLVLDFSAPQPTAPNASGIRTLVLDPGHGGAKGGARGPNGVSEAAVALSLALRVRRLLSRKLPDLRVVLTRDSDREVSLEERIAIANAIGADLFVSIHLNASPSAQHRGGVSTYVLATGPAGPDAQSLGSAARENEATEADLSALATTFASLVRKDQLAGSLDLARSVHAATLRWGRRKLATLEDRGVKSGLFYVLLGARMPAILCESSFITRPEEAAALLTDDYRQLLAEGIAEGVVRFAQRADKARTMLAPAAGP